MTEVQDKKVGVLVGVLALQGAFEEHETCLQAVGCETVQVSTYIYTEDLAAWHPVAHFCLCRLVSGPYSR